MFTPRRRRWQHTSEDFVRPETRIQQFAADTWCVKAHSKRSQETFSCNNNFQNLFPLCHRKSICSRSPNPQFLSRLSAKLNMKTHHISNPEDLYITPARGEGMRTSTTCPPPPRPQDRCGGHQSGKYVVKKPATPNLRIPALLSVDEEPFKPLSPYKLAPRKRPKDDFSDLLFFWTPQRTQGNGNRSFPQGSLLTISS